MVIWNYNNLISFEILNFFLKNVLQGILITTKYDIKEKWLCYCYPEFDFIQAKRIDATYTIAFDVIYRMCGSMFFSFAIDYSFYMCINVWQSLYSFIYIIYSIQYTCDCDVPLFIYSFKSHYYIYIRTAYIASNITLKFNK